MNKEYTYKTEAANKREMRGILKDANLAIRIDDFQSIIRMADRLSKLASEHVS